MAKSLSARCGKEPKSWWIFPSKGNFHGPGGSFESELMVLALLISVVSTIKTKTKKVKRIEKEGRLSSIKNVQMNLLEVVMAHILKL